MMMVEEMTSENKYMSGLVADSLRAVSAEIFNIKSMGVTSAWTSDGKQSIECSGATFEDNKSNEFD